MFYLPPKAPFAALWLVLLALGGSSPRGASAAETALPLSLHGEHRFQAGDDPGFAKPAYDDSGWQTIRVPGSAEAQGLATEQGVGWLRIWFRLPKGPPEPEIAVALGVVWGADETFLNGERIGSEGAFGERPVLPYQVTRVYPLPRSLLRVEEENLLAVRIQNGVDVWGLVNGPVRIGTRSQLEAEREATERWQYVADAALTIFALLALGLWSLFWIRRPLDRVLGYLGAGLLGLLYLTVVGSLPFYHAGLLNPWLYTGMMPALATSLMVSTAAWVLSVSDRHFRVFDLLAGACCLASLAWYVDPSLALGRLLLGTWLAIGTTLILVFYLEVFRASRRNPEDRLLLLACGTGALLASVGGTISAVQVQPSDWTMRYAVFPAYWMVPVFTLIGMTRRLLRTPARLVELSAQVLSAQGEERRRLSRELHDGVAQDLQAAKLGLQMATTASVVDPERGLKSAIGLVSRSIDALRSAAQDLRPLPNANALAESLQRYTEIMTTRSGVPIDFVDRRAARALRRDASDTMAEHLYRIAQEAIGNAIRHGSARRIHVTLELQGSQTVLCVMDDGAGFDIARAEHDSSGLGLSTMRERAALIGGHCRITTSKSGTRIEVSAEA